MTAKATVNPFVAAAKKAVSAIKKSTRPVYVADNLADPAGNLIYRKEEVAEAIHNFVEAHSLAKQAAAMEATNRPIVTNWTKAMFTQDWVTGGTRPENPAITNKADGTGDHMKVLFVDKSAKLDEYQFGQLAALIGSEEAEANVIHRHEFTINPELMDQTAKVREGGKVVERTVMDSIIAALQEKFAPSPEILGILFTAKEKFETKKGLIDKGPALLKTGKTAADAVRLAQFLEVIRAQMQLKVGAKENE